MLKRSSITQLPNGAWGVDLPTYTMVPGSWRPVTPKLIHADGIFPNAEPAAVLAKHPTVEIEIPDNTPLDDDGQIHADKIRKMYAEHPRFGSRKWTPPKLT